MTSPARTLLDEAPLLSARKLELAFDQALIGRVMRPANVEELLARAGSHPGRARLRVLLARQRGPRITRSEAEERFLALVREAQLPEPECNVHLHGYEVDFLWRQQRLVVEIDGFRYHSTRRSFEDDRRKDAALQAAGIATMRVTWVQMELEAYAVIGRLAAGLAGRDRG